MQTIETKLVAREQDKLPEKVIAELKEEETKQSLAKLNKLIKDYFEEEEAQK